MAVSKYIFGRTLDIGLGTLKVQQTLHSLDHILYIFYQSLLNNWSGELLASDIGSRSEIGESEPIATCVMNPVA